MADVSEDGRVWQDFTSAMDVEHEVYHAIKRVYLLLDNCDRQFFTEFGLSSRQFWALQALDDERGRPMVDLSRVLFTDKSNVTGIVDRLESIGLVMRTPAAHDRRVIHVLLTPEGRGLRDKLKAQHDARIRDLMDAMSSETLVTLRNLLTVVGESFESALTDAGARSGDEHQDTSVTE